MVKITGQICGHCDVLVDNNGSDVLCPNCDYTIWGSSFADVFEVTETEKRIYEEKCFIKVN